MNPQTLKEAAGYYQQKQLEIWNSQVKARAEEFFDKLKVNYNDAWPVEVDMAARPSSRYRLGSVLHEDVIAYIQAEGWQIVSKVDTFGRLTYLVQPADVEPKLEPIKSKSLDDVALIVMVIVGVIALVAAAIKNFL